MMEPENWRDRATVTVEQAAPILGVGRSTAYILARTGELPTLRLGRRFVVPVATLRRMLGELAQNDHDPAGNRAEVTTEDTHDVQSAA
jgi:excisionase family DNA binding protein